MSLHEYIDRILSDIEALRMKMGQELGSPAGVIFLVVVGQTNETIDQIFNFGEAGGRCHIDNGKKKLSGDEERTGCKCKTLSFLFALHEYSWIMRK